MKDSTYLVSAHLITKKFSGVPALSNVDFRVRSGEIHALLGQNGAGKSTLVKILTGVHAIGTYTGSVKLLENVMEFNSPGEAQLAGIGYVPQEIEVLEQLSVAENTFAGHLGLGKGPLINRRQIELETFSLLNELGLELDPKTIVASLTSAQRHLVMIARALAHRPRVLILDEPTASLSGGEVEALFDVLRRMRASGVTMIYITHRLPEVLVVCDSATVLRDGKVVAELDREDFDEDAFITSMSGKRIQNQFPNHRTPVKSKPMMEVENLTVEGKAGAIYGAQDISFSVVAGEILGLAGLLGSGRSEILNGIFGHVPAKGVIKIGGKIVSIRSPRDARDAGMALLTEDRKGDGLLFNLPLGQNITIGNLSLLSTGGMISNKRESAAIKDAMQQLAVKSKSAEISVSHLSGGNQQKLLFARVLMREPRILLLDEPTKGVDAATRHEIYRLLVDLAESGVALVVVSSELEELIGLCDRCLTIADGHIVDEFQRGEGDEERVLRAVASAQSENIKAVL